MDRNCWGARIALTLCVVLGGCPDHTPPTWDAGRRGDADAAGPACQGYCAVSLIAGVAGGIGALDGKGAAARFNHIVGIADDGTYLYLADVANSAIRRLDPASGEVSTLAGTLGQRVAAGLQKDGKGAQVTFADPTVLALVGKALYILDADRLRRLDLSTAVVTTVKESQSGKPWRPPSGASMVALTAVGDKLYVGERSAIGELDTKSGAYTFLAGGTGPGAADGVGTAARFFGIRGLAADGADTLWIADTCMVRKLAINSREVSTVAGQASGDNCFIGVKDAVGTAARFQFLMGIAADGQHVYAVEWSLISNIAKILPGFGRVRRIDPLTAAVTTLAGTFPAATAQVGEQDGTAGSARLYRPWGVSASKGAVHVGCSSSVRQITADKVSTTAGVILADPFIRPGPVATDGKQIYVVHNGRHELLRVDRKTGLYEVLQRYDKSTFPLDSAWDMVQQGSVLYILHYNGLAAYDLGTGSVSTLLSFPQTSMVIYPRGLATDGVSLYISSRVLEGALLERQIWRVDPKVSGKYDVQFKALALEENHGIAYHDGALYIADGKRLRRLDLKSGKLSDAAGVADKEGCSGPGAAAPLFTEICDVTSDGTLLYFVDCRCHTAWQLDPKQGAPLHLAGSSGNAGFKAGLSQAAGLNYPRFVAHDKVGDALLISDPSESVIMQLAPAK